MGLVVSAAASRGNRSPPPPTPTPMSQGSPPPSEGTDPELVRVFRLFDTDDDGRISATEMREFFGCTAAEAEEMVSVADSDGDGVISVKEFGALLEGGESDALRSAFAEYDEDGNGMITAEELQRALRRLGHGGEELTDERCAEIVAELDVDGDGVISFDEFKSMMSTKNA